MSFNPDSDAASRLRILVVEPYTDTREQMQSLLAARGHSVAGVDTSANALVWLASNRCDLIFVAVKFDGTGWDLIRQAQLPPQVSGVAMSTGFVNPDRLLKPQWGFHHHLLKPFTLGELNKILEDVGR